MKKLFLTAILAIGLCSVGYSQTSTNMPEPPTLPPILGAINWTATNWVFIPFAGYQVEAKQWGVGGAALYKASDNLWAGARFQHFKDQDVTASVQGQLQVSQKVFGVTLTPFVESSVGLGQSSLYANAGVGGIINFHTWTWTKASLSLGLIGDYEHFVFGDKNGNQVNAGLVVNLKF